MEASALIDLTGVKYADGTYNEELLWKVVTAFLPDETEFPDIINLSELIYITSGKYGDLIETSSQRKKRIRKMLMTLLIPCAILAVALIIFTIWLLKG